MQHLAKWVLVMAITWYCVNPIVTSRTNFTRQPLFGYRCKLDDISNQTTVLSTAREQCVWRCLSSEDCKVVSYNHHLNSCELSIQFCDTIDSHADFSINVYGTYRPFCSRWVRKSEFDEQAAIVFLQKRRSGNIAVARKKEGSGLYPGKHQRFD